MALAANAEDKKEEVAPLTGLEPVIPLITNFTTVILNALDVLGISLNLPSLSVTCALNEPVALRAPLKAPPY